MSDENIQQQQAPAPAAETPNPAAPDANAPAPEAVAAAAEAAPAPGQSELVTPPPVVVEEVAGEVGDDGIVSFEPTGDTGLDVALEFIGNLGIAGQDPALVAAANGNFALLEAKLATLGDKAAGWPQMIALAKDAYTRTQTQYAEHVKKTDAAILGVVETADNWAAIKNWAAANGTPEEKAEINKMIDAGPVQARAAATLLLGAYRKATGTVINPANPARHASGENPANDGGKLSQRDYAAAVRSLHLKLGSRMEGSQEYAALQRRLAR